MFASKMLITLGLTCIILPEFQVSVAARSIRQRSRPMDHNLEDTSDLDKKKYYYFMPSLAHDSKLQISAESANDDYVSEAGLNGRIVKAISMPNRPGRARRQVKFFINPSTAI